MFGNLNHLSKLLVPFLLYDRTHTVLFYNICLPMDTVWLGRDCLCHNAKIKYRPVKEKTTCHLKKEIKEASIIHHLARQQRRSCVDSLFMP